MKARKGASIVLILIMVMLLSILGTQVLVTLNSETKANMNKVDNTQAAYVAQAMAESFAVYMKERTQEEFLNLYKSAKGNGLVIEENSEFVRVDKKYYTSMEVKAEDLKKTTDAGVVPVEGKDFQDFKAEGIIKFYDLSDGNAGINKGDEHFDPALIRKVRARAEGWINKGTADNPNYSMHGIDMYFYYDIENNKIYGEEPASIIVKNSFSMNKGVRPINVDSDLDSGIPTGVVVNVKHKLSTGLDQKIANMERDLGLRPGQIKVVNKDNEYYNYRFPDIPDYQDVRDELIRLNKNEVMLNSSKMKTEDKVVVNKILEYFDSTRGIVFNKKVEEREKNLNGTLFDGTYYGGSKLLKTKPAYSINGNEALTSGVYKKLRSKNNALSSYIFNIENPNNYFSSRSIVIDTKKDEITKIVLDELDIQSSVFIRGEGLVHFYVKDRVRIGNLSTLFTESFIFLNPISDDNADHPIMNKEIVSHLGQVHHKNNASRVTIFYYGTDPVVLSGTIESTVNIVAKNADIILSPTVGQFSLVNHKNLTFKGVLISGQDININLGKIGGAISDTFKYRIKGLFYAPYGDIIVDAKKPSVIAGTMIAQNISLKCPDRLIGNAYIGLKTGYEYNYKEMNNRGIGMVGSKFYLAFMKNI